MKVSCKVNRIEVKELNVGGAIKQVAVVKLVPVDTIGDFYFEVPGGEVAFNADDEVIEAKNQAGFVVDRKVTHPAGTRPLSVKSPEGAVFAEGATVVIDLTPA